MHMKSIIKTIGYAILYDLAGCCVYVPLMLLFACMAHWWYIFIILIGLGCMGLFIQLVLFSAAFTAVLKETLFGKILCTLITIHLLYFAIHSVWITDFKAEHEKEITVKIIATIIFSTAYLTVLFVTIFSTKETDS